MTREEMTTRLEELSGLAAEAQEQLASVEEDLTQALESGEGDPADLLALKQGIATRIEAYDKAGRSLSDKIDEAEDEALLEEARTEIKSGRKRVGGLAGEHHRNIERANELFDQLGPILAKVLNARVRQDWESFGLAALASRFGLDAPELKMVDRPGSDPDIKALKERLEGMATSEIRPPGPGLSRRTLTERATIASDALARLFASESAYGTILERAGPSAAEIRAQAEAERRRAEKEAKDARLLEGLDGERARAVAFANPRTSLGPS